MKIEKNKKYLIATDLDGTFLTSETQSMNIHNQLVVKKLQELGHHFVIATGRSWWWTSKIYDQLELTTAAVHFSGSQVHHPTDKQFKNYFAPISKEIVLSLSSEDWATQSTMTMVIGEVHQAHFNNREEMNHLFFDGMELIYKYDKTVDSKALHQDVLEKHGDKFEIRHWETSDTAKYNEIVFNAKNTSKAIGLQKIADFYDIPKERVIYFGDNINDVEALEWAGIGIAVANAKPEAKKAANYVSEHTNDYAAVAKEIEKLFEL